MKNEVNQAEKLQRKSVNELKEIARLRRIKNRDELKKEDLIISLLKSEISDAERNYMKHFNNNTVDDDTFDGKIRGIKCIQFLTNVGSTLGHSFVKKNFRYEYKKILLATIKKFSSQLLKTFPRNYKKNLLPTIKHFFSQFFFCFVLV